MKIWAVLLIFLVVIAQDTPNPQVKKIPNENMQKKGETIIKENEKEISNEGGTGNLLNESNS
jgi:hypothetical protein